MSVDKILFKDTRYCISCGKNVMASVFIERREIKSPQFTVDKDNFVVLGRVHAFKLRITMCSVCDAVIGEVPL